MTMVQINLFYPTMMMFQYSFCTVTRKEPKSDNEMKMIFFKFPF